MTEHSAMCLARTGILMLATLAVTAPAWAQQEGAPPFPPSAVDSLAERGGKIFHGVARCAVCHGDDGRGTEDGPDLTDATWIHGDGTYGGILGMVHHGVARRDAETGRPMPIRGWEPVDDAAAAAVAVYVWTLSHGGGRR